MRKYRVDRAAVLTILVTASLAVGTLAFAQTAQGLSPHPVPLITAPIDETQRMVLRGNTPPQVQSAFDRGPVADAYPLTIELVLRIGPEQERALNALIGRHQALTAHEYDELVRAPEDIATIGAWLRGHGFTLDDPSPSVMLIRFSGTAGQVRRVFSTEIHEFEVDGERRIANVSNPSIPAALAPAILGILGLDDFRVSHRGPIVRPIR